MEGAPNSTVGNCPSQTDERAVRPGISRKRGSFSSRRKVGANINPDTAGHSEVECWIIIQRIEIVSVEILDRWLFNTVYGGSPQRGDVRNIRWLSLVRGPGQIYGGDAA